jgi:hypothetical protein
VLPGAAAKLQHVAGLRAQKSGHRRPDGIVIALERGALQPAVGRGFFPGLSEFDDEFSHGCNGLFARAMGVSFCWRYEIVAGAA